MKLINYSRLSDLIEAANKFGLIPYQTKVSYSFRIFDEHGLTSELHLFKLK